MGVATLFSSTSVQAAEGGRDHSHKISTLTAPASLEKLKPEEAEWRTRQIMDLLRLEVTSKVDAATAMDTALIRNRMPLARRQAMRSIFAGLYKQAIAMKLWDQPGWFLPEQPPEAAPKLVRVLSAEEYPQYASEIINFNVGEPSERYRAQLLTLLQSLPPVGTVVEQTRAAATTTTAEPAAAEDIAETTPAPSPAKPQIVVSDSSVSSGLGATHSYDNTTMSTYVQDPETGNMILASPTPYYTQPYYPARPIYPVRPPIDNTPKPPKPTHSKSTFVDPNPYTGGEKFKSTSKTARPSPPPYNSTQMTPEQYYQTYGVRP